MYTKTIETSGNPHITVTECLGDLAVQGGDTAQIVLEAGDGSESVTIIEEAEDYLVLSACEDCRILCPVGTTLDIKVARGDLKVHNVQGHIATGEINGDFQARITGVLTAERVFGDLSAQQVQGELTVGEVNGDLHARTTGALKLERVFGDLSAQQVQGDVHANNISADARISKVNGEVILNSVAADARINDVTGKVTLAQVGSDLKASGLEQGLVAEAVGADVKLRPPYAPGAEYIVRAGSDLVIKLPEEPNVSLKLLAGAGVRSNVPGLNVQGSEGNVNAVLGEGAATIKAQAGGRVKIVGYGEAGPPEDFDFDFDFSFLEELEAIGPVIEARVSAAMAELDTRLQEGLSALDSDRFRVHIERAAEKAERAATRVAERAREVAEREAERARRNAERDAQHARMRAEKAERRWRRASGVTPPAPPAPPAPAATPAAAAPVAPVEPVSADTMREERMQILRMVENGTITSEDAANLLAALR